MIDDLTSRILEALPPERSLVAIDGMDGSGKSRFATDLVRHVCDRPVVLVHADDFLNPAEVRRARGRYAPEGHWFDSYDYDALRSRVLEPLSRGGDGWYRATSADTDPIHAPDDAVVVIEGLFLHRDELFGLWDMSIFLHVPFDEAVRRMAHRDGANPDPSHHTIQRYIGGNKLYFEQCVPWDRATVVVDNTDFGAPRIVEDRLAER